LKFCLYPEINCLFIVKSEITASEHCDANLKNGTSRKTCAVFKPNYNLIINELKSSAARQGQMTKIDIKCIDFENLCDLKTTLPEN